MGEDEDEKPVEQKRVNLKEIVDYFLPTFLFKWGSFIDFEIDLSEIKNYCT